MIFHKVNEMVSDLSDRVKNNHRKLDTMQKILKQ